MQVARGVELFARHNDADDRLLALVLDSHVVAVEGNLHAVGVHLVVDDGGVVDVSIAHGCVLRLHDEEVLERTGTVEGCREVGEVVAELHGLVVHAVHPASQHGHLGGRHGSCRVACILEVLEVDGLVGLRGVEVGGYAGAEQHLASARVVHAYLDGAQGAIDLADVVRAGRPHHFAGAHAVAVLVGAVDEAVVLPSVAPRVGYDPGAHLVLVGLAHLAVSIEVELYAVVVAHDGEGVVVGVAPGAHVFHAGYADVLVVLCRGDALPRAVGSHAYAGHAARVERFVATVVVEPFLEHLAPFGGVGGRERERRFGPVPHGAEPLVVALHPAVVVVVVRLCAEEPAVRPSPVGDHVGDAVRAGHHLLVAVLVGQQPGEVGGVHVLGQRAVQVAPGVYFMSEHIGDVLCRAARTSVLVEDRREVLVLAVVHVVGQLHLDARALPGLEAPVHGVVRRARGLQPEVGEEPAVHLDCLVTHEDLLRLVAHACDVSLLRPYSQPPCHQQGSHYRYLMPSPIHFFLTLNS